MIGGARRDERTKQVTITLNVGSSGSALLNAFITGSSLAFDREVTLSLTLDRNFRAIELGLNATGTLAGGTALPAVLAGPLGDKKLMAAARRGDTDGRRWEVAARVDLDDPEIAAAWAAFRHDPTNSDAIRALAGQLRDRANLDVRTYALHSESSGAGAGLGVGVRVEGEIAHTVDRARLLAAATRPPGGLWEQRSDCVAA